MKPNVRRKGDKDVKRENEKEKNKVENKLKNYQIDHENIHFSLICIFDYRLHYMVTGMCYVVFNQSSQVDISSSSFVSLENKKNSYWNNPILYLAIDKFYKMLLKKFIAKNIYFNVEHFMDLNTVEILFYNMLRKMIPSFQNGRSLKSNYFNASK